MPQATSRIRASRGRPGRAWVRQSTARRGARYCRAATSWGQSAEPAATLCPTVWGTSMWGELESARSSCVFVCVFSGLGPCCDYSEKRSSQEGLSFPCSGTRPGELPMASPPGSPSALAAVLISRNDLSHWGVMGWVRGQVWYGSGVKGQKGGQCRKTSLQGCVTVSVHPHGRPRMQR